MEYITDDEDFMELVEHIVHPRVRREPQDRPDYFETLDENQFKARFRFSKAIVLFIADEIGPEVASNSNKNHALLPQEKVLITLRFLATGSFLQVIGDFIGVDKGTASRVVHQVLCAIARLRPQFVTLPSTADEIQKVKQGFYNIARFPNCVGAIDCTHIKIQSPGGDNAELFRNRKQFFSYNVQVVCDAFLKIQDVVCRWPGSAHDSTIFNNSRVMARMENRDFGNSLLVGDSGYAVKRYLITPLRNPQTRTEHTFNESQIRTRNPVERTFGVWKRRFPALALGIRLDSVKVEAVVVAAAVLHNIAIAMGDGGYNFDYDEVEIAIQNALNINPDLMENAGINQHNIVRHNLINEYFATLH